MPGEPLTLVVGQGAFLARSLAGTPDRPPCRFVGHRGLDAPGIFDGVTRVENQITIQRPSDVASKTRAGANKAAEGVGTAVTEHGPAGKIGRQAAGCSANSRCRAGADQPRAQHNDHLGCPPGP